MMKDLSHRILVIFTEDNVYLQFSEAPKFKYSIFQIEPIPKIVSPMNIKPALLTYSIQMEKWAYTLIECRAHAFEGKKIKMSLLSKIGRGFSFIYRKVFNDWVENPLQVTDSYSAPTYIFQDLMITCNLFSYVPVEWADALKAPDTFTRADLHDFLDYLLKREQTNLPILITDYTAKV